MTGVSAKLARRGDTTLILIGHGSSKSITSGATVRGHAAHLRETAGFAQVRAAFWQEPPLIAGCLDRIPTRRAVIVPVLACAGHITNTVIPKQLAANRNTSAEITVTAPVGTHWDFYHQGADVVRELADRAGLPADTVLLLVGHGNNRNPASARQTLTMAKAAKRTGRFAKVSTAFLEQMPLLDRLRSVVGAPENLLVTPCMISGGLHAARHIPQMLRLPAHDPGLIALAQGQSLCGPYPVLLDPASPTQIWYSRPLGSEPFVSRLILSLADRALTPKSV